MVFGVSIANSCCLVAIPFRIFLFSRGGLAVETAARGAAAPRNPPARVRLRGAAVACWVEEELAEHISPVGRVGQGGDSRPWPIVLPAQATLTRRTPREGRMVPQCGRRRIYVSGRALVLGRDAEDGGVRPRGLPGCGGVERAGVRAGCGSPPSMCDVVCRWRRRRALSCAVAPKGGPVGDGGEDGDQGQGAERPDGQ